MKRLTIWTTVALITFLLGVAATALWVFSGSPSSYQLNRPKAQAARSHSPLPEVLHDFQFVGSGVFSTEVPSHGVVVQPHPQEFEAGHQYIFHRAPTDNDALFQELQNRFRSKGVNVPEASGRLWRYIGGLVFRISFDDGRYKGYISNSLDGEIVRSEDLSRRLSVDDYVVVIEEVRGGQ